MKKSLSRLECSKEVRRGLNRHGVDLSYCQYICTSYEIRLTGFLCKTDGSEFNASQIEALMNDFIRKLPGRLVNGDMDNWKFSLEHIMYLGEKKTLSPSVPSEENDYEDVG